jgi:phenylacetate-CoA ligase
MRDAKRPRSELDRVVHRRLRSVLVSAYRHVPYYRELMRSVGYDPVRGYHGPGDLSRLPIITKEVLRKRGPMAFTKEGSDLSGYFCDATSGSTGIPLRVYRAPYERAVQIAKWLRVLFLNGYSVRHRVMSLTSPKRLSQGRSVLQRFGLLRRLAVDYLIPAGEIVDILLAYRPDVLYGNRIHLDLVALELGRRGIQPRGLRLLVGTGEVIHDSTRQLYRKRFGVELVESYGSVEMGVMAYETQAHDGLHLCEDLTYFEFLDEEGKPVSPGRPARVVVTDLIGKLEPLIRYDIGDLAVLEDGAGGFNDGSARRITRVIGREEDYVLLPDGTRRSAHDFYEIINRYEDIAQFRIVQRAQDLFLVSIVADTACFLNVRDSLLGLLKRKFPPTVSFDIVRKERIDPDPGGKLSRFVSEVD